MDGAILVRWLIVNPIIVLPILRVVLLVYQDTHGMNNYHLVFYQFIIFRIAFPQFLKIKIIAAINIELDISQLIIFIVIVKNIQIIQINVFDVLQIFIWTITVNVSTVQLKIVNSVIQMENVFNVQDLIHIFFKMEVVMFVVQLIHVNNVQIQNHGVHFVNKEIFLVMMDVVIHVLWWIVN